MTVEGSLNAKSVSVDNGSNVAINGNSTIGTLTIGSTTNGTLTFLPTGTNAASHVYMINNIAIQNNGLLDIGNNYVMDDFVMEISI